MSKNVTLRDIARKADLSVGAVSKALSGYRHVSAETRRRVQRICADLDYRPRPKQRDQTAIKQVGLLMVQRQQYGFDPMSILFPDLAVHAIQRSMQLELHLVTDTSESGWDQWRAKAAHLHGVIVIGPLSVEHLAQLDRLSRPWVALGHVISSRLPVPLSGHTVCTDWQLMGYHATTWLIDQGHRRIGFFCGPSPEGMWNDQWTRGYRLALLEAGLPDDPELRLMVDPPDRRDVGHHAAEKYLAMPARRLPTAWLTPTVLGAARFIHRMGEAGHTINRNQMVFGGATWQASDHNVEQYPMISEDWQGIDQVAVAMLRQAIDQQAPTPSRIIVPYTTRNLDLP